jgi:hypothetical protein
MRKPITSAALLAVILCFIAPGFAADKTADKPADNMQILQDKVKADKKLLVATNMQLTEAEAGNFWPIYDSYQKDLETLNKRTVAMIKFYADAFNSKSINDEKADKLVADLLAIQMDEVKLLQSYVPKLRKVLPAIKVARYIQIENKIRAAVKYELANQIPLVQ